MYDGIASDAAAIAAIPTAIGLVAGYDDGDYAWSAADWGLFPNSTHVHIVVHQGTNSGTVLDVESGNASPAQAVGWVVMRRAAGAYPTVYCGLANWPSVRAAFQAAGVAEPHYWVASYDGNTAIPAGATAHQYESLARWDVSSVADYWPGVDEAPEPTPPARSPAITQEDDEMPQIEPLAVHPGEYAYGAIGKTRIVFCADGYSEAPASLRVVFWVGDNPQVHDAVAVGGDGTKAASINFPPGGINAVTVRREDTSGFPISVQLA